MQDWEGKRLIVAQHCTVFQQPDVIDANNFISIVNLAK